MGLLALPRPLCPSKCNEDEVRGTHPWNVLHQLSRQLLPTVRLQQGPRLQRSQQICISNGTLLPHLQHKVWDEQQDVNLVPRPLSRAPLFNVASANPGTKKTGTGTKVHSFLL